MEANRGTTLRLLFVRKMDLILHLVMPERMLSAQELRKKARLAVETTMPETKKGTWETTWRERCLAPDELEIVLLYAVVCGKTGQETEGWEYIERVWRYPGRHDWDARMLQLIWPQTALAALSIGQRGERHRRAVMMAQEAVEILRKAFSQRYLLMLLERLCEPSRANELPGQLQEEYRDYRDTFRRLYQKYDCPPQRLWQNIGIENAMEIGELLRRLRTANGIKQKEAGVDDHGRFVSTEQLNRIEHGKHAPTPFLVQSMMQLYGRKAEVVRPILDTASLPLLKLQREISEAFAMKDYQKADEQMAAFRVQMDPENASMKQQLLYWEAIRIKETDKISLERQLELLQKALLCTVDFSKLNLAEYPFTRTEGMIYWNMAVTMKYQKKTKQAIEIFSLLYQNNQKRAERYGIYMDTMSHVNMSYAGALGERCEYELAFEIAKDGIKKQLKMSKIKEIEELLYECSWDAYEMINNIDDTYRIEAQENFLFSLSLASFLRIDWLIRFLEARKEKYVKELSIMKVLEDDCE